MIAAVATLDVLTSWQVPLGLLYLAPICIVAYHHNAFRTAAAVVGSVGAWTLADVLAQRPFSHPAVPFVNIGIRLFALGSLGWFIARAQARRLRERDLVQFVLHDLRNPVTALGLALDRMAETGDPPPGIVPCRHALSRMNGLIESLVGLTKLERGHMVIKQEPFSIKEALDTAVRTFSTTAAQVGVRLPESSGIPDVRATGDRDLAIRVFENLLGNAIKVSPPDTEIRIHVEPAEGQRIIIQIQDQGPGIPPHLAQRVFEPYVQFELGRKQATSGYGLGLAFCRAAIRNLGGRIWIDPTPGPGTCLALSLPAVPASASGLPEQGAAPVLARDPNEVETLGPTSMLAKTFAGTAPDPLRVPA